MSILSLFPRLTELFHPATSDLEVKCLLGMILQLLSYKSSNNPLILTVHCMIKFTNPSRKFSVSLLEQEIVM